MRWTGYVAYTGELRKIVLKLNGKDHSDDLGIDGRILTWILEK
jgi:hypothetical protein